MQGAIKKAYCSAYERPAWSKKNEYLQVKPSASLEQSFTENCVIYRLKNCLVLIAIVKCFWLSAQHGYSSAYRVGLKLGYSLHTMTGDLTETQPGGNLLGGLWFQLKMNKKWTAQTELMLLDKGIGVRKSGKSPHFVNLHYFEVPILFQYHKNKVYVEFGPGLAYLINYRENLYSDERPELVNAYPFMGSELSLQLGIACALTEKWAIGLRLSHSVLPVRQAVPSVSDKSYNRLFALSLQRQLKKKKVGSSQE